MNSIFKHPQYVRFPGYSNNGVDTGRTNMYNTTFRFTNPFGSANWYLFLDGFTDVANNQIRYIEFNDNAVGILNPLSQKDFIYTEGGNGGGAEGIWDSYMGTSMNIKDNLFVINRGSVYSLYRLMIQFQSGSMRIYFGQTYQPALATSFLCLTKATF